VAVLMPKCARFHGSACCLVIYSRCPSRLSWRLFTARGPPLPVILGEIAGTLHQLWIPWLLLNTVCFVDFRAEENFSPCWKIILLKDLM
jgi:hypothetical protein